MHKKMAEEGPTQTFQRLYKTALLPNMLVYPCLSARRPDTENKYICII